MPALSVPSAAAVPPRVTSASRSPPQPHAGPAGRLQARWLAKQGCGQALLSPEQGSGGLHQALRPPIWWLHPSATPTTVDHRATNFPGRQTCSTDKTFSTTFTRWQRLPLCSCPFPTHHRQQPAPLHKENQSFKARGGFCLFFTAGKPNACCNRKIKMDLIENPDTASEPGFPEGKKLPN